MVGWANAVLAREINVNVAIFGVQQLKHWWPRATFCQIRILFYQVQVDLIPVTLFTDTQQ